MSWHQIAAGTLAGFGMKLLYGVQYTDMCAFRAIRRDVLLGLGMSEMTYGWNIEMQMRAARSGLRILEIPFPIIGAPPAARRSRAASAAPSAPVSESSRLLSGYRRRPNRRNIRSKRPEVRHEKLFSASRFSRIIGDRVIGR